MDASYDDAVGDTNFRKGPDLLSIAVVNDANGNIGIAASYANRTCISTGGVDIRVDVDQSPATGGGGTFEYILTFRSPNTLEMWQWTGVDLRCGESHFSRVVQPPYGCLLLRPERVLEWCKRHGIRVWHPRASTGAMARRSRRLVLR